MFPILNDPVEQTAYSEWQTLTSDLYPEGMLGNLNMEYRIVSSGGDVITLEVNLTATRHLSNIDDISAYSLLCCFIGKKFWFPNPTKVFAPTLNIV